MAVYMTKAFARFSRKAGLTPQVLLDAAAEVVEGRFEADLGGGVLKKRVARQGSGKSGGSRTVLFFKAGRDVYFAHGFAKNQKASVTARELETLKKAAAILLQFGRAEVEAAERAGNIIAVELIDDD